MAHISSQQLEPPQIRLLRPFGLPHYGPGQYHWRLLHRLIVSVWAAVDSLIDYFENWQFVINIGTIIVTLLMVFLLQRSQNIDSLVMHLKSNEPIVVTKDASNRLINAQDFTGEEARIIAKIAVPNFLHNNLGTPPCP